MHVATLPPTEGSTIMTQYPAPGDPQYQSLGEYNAAHGLTPDGLYLAPAPTPAPLPRHGLAVASLVLGLVGSLLGLIPLLCYLALILGVVGLVLGLLARKHGMGKAGAILSLLAVTLSIVGMVIVANAFNHVDHCVNDTTISQDGTISTPAGC